MMTLPDDVFSRVIEGLAVELVAVMRKYPAGAIDQRAEQTNDIPVWRMSYSNGDCESGPRYSPPETRTTSVIAANVDLTFDEVVMVVKRAIAIIGNEDEHEQEEGSD